MDGSVDRRTEGRTDMTKYTVAYRNLGSASKMASSVVK